MRVTTDLNAVDLFQSMLTEATIDFQVEYPELGRLGPGKSIVITAEEVHFEFSRETGDLIELQKRLL